MHQLNWNDLHYVLVVARTGSLAAAARLLKVNRTTVLRRVNALETRLGYPLFERSRSGYVVTPETEQLLSGARALEKSILELEWHTPGHNLQIEGDIRVTTTDSILPLIVKHLTGFYRQHPLIRVELAVTNNRLSLTHREADVAVRPTVNPPDNLWGRQIAELAFAVYASSSYEAENSGKPFAEHRWIGLDEPLSGSLPGRWMRTEIPEEHIRFRADSFVALRLIVEQGLGLALLPCHIGDSSERLMRIGSPLPELNVGLWILTHGDLARTARVRAFIDHISSSIIEQRGVMLGSADMSSGEYGPSGGDIQPR